MPLTDTEARKIFHAIAIAYADLYCRHQALVQMLSHARGAPVEAVESELQAWREEHSDQVWDESAHRLKGLFHTAKIFAGNLTDPPVSP